LTWQQRARGLATPILGSAVLCGLAIGPSVLAARRPPAGRAFSGTFLYQDDYFQHLSFVEQATRGAFCFVNKFDLAPHEPIYFNLGLWLAGLLGRFWDGQPASGFLALHGLIAGAFVLALVRLLRLAEASPRRTFWVAVLASLGGGLGWLRLWQHARADQVVDVSFALFPWLQLQAAPYALLGSALLLWGLTEYVAWRFGSRSKWTWLAAAWILGLSRPFDLVVLALAVTLVEGLERLRGRGCRGLQELVWLTPVFFYDGLVLAFHPAFLVWSGAQNAVALPPWYELASGLGPAAALAALGARRWWGPAGVRRALFAWALAVSALLCTGLSFAVQFATSLGLVLLLLAGLSLAERWLPVAAALLSPTALVLLWQFVNPPPSWFPPRDYQSAIAYLQGACRGGDVVYAPTDPSLMVAGLTPCRVAIGHRVLTPELATRAGESARFFDARTSARWRGEYLAGIGARFVMIPAGREAWLAGTGFRRRLALGILEVWESGADRSPTPQ
jgi:hypothetical protein